MHRTCPVSICPLLIEIVRVGIVFSSLRSFLILMAKLTPHKEEPVLSVMTGMVVAFLFSRKQVLRRIHLVDRKNRIANCCLRGMRPYYLLCASVLNGTFPTSDPGSERNHAV